MDQNEQHIINSLQKKKTELPPDDYFAALKNDLLGKTGKETKVIPLYRKWWFVSSAAAGIVLIAALSVFLKPGNSAVNDPDWSSVTTEDMYAYVENNIQEFETEDVAAQLTAIPEWHTEVSIAGSAAEQTDNKESTLFDGLDKQEILEYLQEDVVEIDDEQITGY